MLVVRVIVVNQSRSALSAGGNPVVVPNGVKIVNLFVCSDEPVAPSSRKHIDIVTMLAPTSSTMRDFPVPDEFVRLEYRAYTSLRVSR